MKGFFQELQTKRIYRVAGGYIVSAWVILQVAAIVSPGLELPSWTVKAVLDVLLLGFVPALLLGSRTVSGRRGQHAWRYLSGVFGFNRLAFKRDLLPGDYRGSHFSCERAE